MRFYISLLLVFQLLFCAPVLAWQTITGTLSGRVIDESLTPLVGVVVRVTHLSNGFVYAKKTDLQGIYRIDFLPAGEYRIEASKEGYKSNIIERFVAEVNREKVIKPPPIQLIPVSLPQPVTVPQNIAGVLQANIADSTLRGSATTEFITALPLTGIRSFDAFALLVAGVLPAPTTNGVSGPGIGVVTAGQFSVNGARARANNFTIDGSDNNDQDVGVRRQGFTLVASQTAESITEFEISTLLSNAEAGRNTGGQINIVSRTGGNKINGEVYNFFTDSALNARDFFDLSNQSNPKKNPFTRNQVGAAIGFPLIANKLNLFANFEHKSINRVQEEHFSVPTTLERASSLNLARRSSKLGLDILDQNFYPLPNNLGGPYQENTLTRILAASGRGTLFSIKSDYRLPIEKASNLTTRYNFTDDKTTIPSVDQAINSSIQAKTRTQNLALALNIDLSANTANQARFSYGRTALSFQELAGSPFIFQSGSTGQDFNADGQTDGRTGPIGRILLAPFSPIGIDTDSFPQGRVNNTFQFANTTAITKGMLSLKFGVDIRRVQLNSFLDRNYRTQITFNSGFINRPRQGLTVGTGTNFAAFGLPADISQALAIVPDSTLALRFTETNFFIHSQLRVQQNLTLELGLRYERNSIPTDATGRLERSLTIMDSELPPFDPTRPTAQVFLRSLAAQRVFLDGRQKIYEADNNNFAPRISFAYDLSKKGRLALRGGYGLFYDPILGTLVNQSRNAFPNFIPVNFGSSILFSEALTANPAFIRFGNNLDIPLIQFGTLNTVGLPQNQFITGLGALLQVEGGLFMGSGFGAGVTLPEKNLKSSYLHQYSLSLEKVLLDRYTLTLAYVGTSARKLTRVRTPNAGQSSSVGIRLIPGFPTQVIPTLKRPNLALGAVTVFESAANSNYNALQASLTRKFSEGIALQVAYNYSHVIDDVSDIYTLVGSFAVGQDELGRNEGLKSERASANFDVRHRFTGAAHFDLSALSNSKILSGLELAAIATLQTGQPFTVNSSVDVNFDGNLTDRLNTTEGLIISSNGRSRIKLQPNTSFVSLLAPVDLATPSNGAVGRNTFRSAGIASLDLAVIKKLAITDSQSLVLRLEAFNLFNRTHFGVPVRILESPSFGSSVNTNLSPRTIQFALRYQF
ncbi:MAG: carboxypeptidase regulatory-like domain-containing protein [Blastocatellia bacterium]|nr:carboxypeptidase regulatory-like domain-containing protein [Blastocatellia bacterium]